MRIYTLPIYKQIPLVCIIIIPTNKPLKSPFEIKLKVAENQSLF